MNVVSRLAMAALLTGGALLTTQPCRAAGNQVLFHEDFEHGLGTRWGQRGFPSIPRTNVFSIADEIGGNHFLRVESTDSSSALGVRLRFAPARCPELSWRWRVSNVIAHADLTRRQGDDAAAKVYVIFRGPSWWNPLDKRILVYVWDNTMPRGSIVPNAWLPDRERMVVLESGGARTDRWVAERVDLVHDFARAFAGDAAGDVEGMAVFADTDNTHRRVSAAFDDVEIRCPEPEQ